MTKADIQFVRSLADKRARTEHGLFVAEGEKLISELLASPMRVRRIYSLAGVFDTRNDCVETVSEREMERISQLKTPNNSLAVVEIPTHSLRSVDAAHSLVLALDRVQNPGNLGTIMRLADWFGITDIVCSEDCADCFNPKVVQATMGAIIRVNVHYTDLAAWLDGENRSGTPIYGTFLDGDDIYSTDLSTCGVIVMGNEGRGIGDECAASVSRRLFIPPYPADRRGSESLNVAIATSVICAEFRRRNGSKR